MLRQSGVCETTSTYRYEIKDCTCNTYPDNLGPCGTWEVGGNGNCVYCDHTRECHIKASTGGSN